MKIEVVISMGPRQVVCALVDCEPGSTAAHAKSLSLQQLGLNAKGFSPWRSAVWGKAVQMNTPLVQGDRLELLRPLLVDPKLARKQRFKRQGKGRTGLFARRRVGSVAGY